MRKTSALFVVSLLAASAGACRKTPDATTSREPVAAGVKIETIAAMPVEDSYEATGTVRSRAVTVVSSRIMGSVIAITVHEGDRVRAGQKLVEIDNRDATAQLQKAEAGMREAADALEEIDRNTKAAQASKAAADAGLALATSTSHRYEALYERRSVSPQEFDEVQAKRKVAEAEAERAARMLSALEARKNQVLARIDQAKADVANARVFAGYANVTSPISGIVTAKHAEVGTMAAPGAPLITVEDDSLYRLEAAVEESQINAIHNGDQARVQIDALGDDEMAGRVAEIVPAADPASRSYTVKIDLPSNRALRSGLYGKARFAAGGTRQAITIPAQAVVERGQLAGVFVVDQSGVVRLRIIKTGKRFRDRVEVLSGLSESERMIVEGLANVADGSRVQ